ncbi:MAG: prolyl oligopeptidase family serine peptidase [Chitinophagales bacterium]|nr:prolyl oligopeptidase family serine peptidase [Chitinophagales bacterium]
MRWISLVCLLVLANVALKAQLTVEKIMQDPIQWIGTSPSHIFWSADSKTIYFNWNPDQNSADSLYKYDIKTQSIALVSLSEQQTLPQKYSATYTRDGAQMLFLRAGDIFLKDLQTYAERQLTNTAEQKSNPFFSRDETQVIYKQGNKFFAIHLDSGLISQLVHFVEGKNEKEIPNNAADKVLEQDQQELFMVLRAAKSKKEATDAYREKTKQKKWSEIVIGKKQLISPSTSPDLQYVFYKLRDQDSNNKGTIIPNYVTASGYTEDIQGRSKVGLPEPIATAYLYHFKTDTSIAIQLGNIPGIQDQPAYLQEYPNNKVNKNTEDRAVEIFGPIWSPLAQYAVVVVRAQDRKDRWIMQLHPETGTLSLIDRQRDEAWIGGPGIGNYSGTGMMGFVDEHTLYFQSEATGYSHLYTYNFRTHKKRQITKGNFEVQQIQLSKDKKWFYMTTNEVHPGETHFYKMSVSGDAKIQITQMEGGHETVLSPDEKTLAFRYSNATTPWELYIMENHAGAQAQKITASTTDAFNAYPWKTPGFISFTARDGHEVYARIYQPQEANKKAVIFVHGAGYLQNAHKWWSQYYREYMFHNLLVDLGYTVLDIDYRASSGYGRDTRTGIYRHMGGKDLDDQVDGAHLLIEKYGINPDKIGIYGGSYGGFITLMAMFTTPDVFAAGAALRPVTDWAAYNQGYTANILNEPQNDSIAYRRSSPIFFAEGLKGQLLICHGQVDVNVHIQDSYRLVQRLIELRKENWEMASYPVEDHGFVQPTSWMDEYKRILKLFENM